MRHFGSYFSTLQIQLEKLDNTKYNSIRHSLHHFLYVTPDWAWSLLECYCSEILGSPAMFLKMIQSFLSSPLCQVMEAITLFMKLGQEMAKVPKVRCYMCSEYLYTPYRQIDVCIRVVLILYTVLHYKHALLSKFLQSKLIF